MFLGCLPKLFLTAFTDLLGICLLRFSPEVQNRQMVISFPSSQDRFRFFFRGTVCFEFPFFSKRKAPFCLLGSGASHQHSICAKTHEPQFLAMFSSGGCTLISGAEQPRVFGKLGARSLSRLNEDILPCVRQSGGELLFVHAGVLPHPALGSTVLWVKSGVPQVGNEKAIEGVSPRVAGQGFTLSPSVTSLASAVSLKRCPGTH